MQRDHPESPSRRSNVLTIEVAEPPKVGVLERIEGQDRVIDVTLEAAPLTDEQRTILKVDQNWKWWTGRAVSKSLSINMAPPATSASEK